MRFKEKLTKNPPGEIWEEYCGFLDLSIDEYMMVQNRLLDEQIELFSKCGLGQKIMHGQRPKGVDEFRRIVPLTTYEDYAEVLLNKKESMLPSEPVVWLETTWESGTHP